MQKKYTVQELDELSIFDVRAIARTVGVTSPTKHNKGELIEFIYKISNGLMAPPEPPRHGRPPKTRIFFTGEQASEPTESDEKKTEQPIEAVKPQPESNFKEEVQPNPQSENGAVQETFIRSKDFKGVNSKYENINGKYERKGFKPREYGNRDFNTNRDLNSNKENNSAREYDVNKGFSAAAQNNTAVSDVYVSDDARGGRVSLKDESGTFVREGYLEVSTDSYGFLRMKPFECSDKDAYVSLANIRKYSLRRGDYVVANCRRGMDENRPAPIVDVISINGLSVEESKQRPHFGQLTPIYPETRIRLEVPNQPRDYAMRCIDLVSPIGMGQRAMIVSPPKAGKTTLLKMIANSITKNYPNIVLKVLLIDERPEEVTDMQRSVAGEVIYSTFDELPEHHTKTAEMLLDRCKRLVETGKDVVILLDSLTRLARAYNLAIPPTGRTLSGGLDPGALHSPKGFFGSARNLEANPVKNFKGGSLTIIATALVDTGSRMDEVIFEEFKGTGNMEIHLDRKLSEKRVFPAIDLAKSSTRKEEMLLTPEELEGTWGIRKMLSISDNADATENLINMIVKTSSNKEFISQLNMQLRVCQKEGYIFRTVK